ncbi:glycoside hydrolase family 76 protein [Mixia osmundae IAM 14324]|uniref:Mannan endo-1,6-alpha-mannosidase n=1 Tax=Mixia osmundae (strain CBS 9802 / IAM 14324 / JCM 22182 / KY 12970) TaxID=764103 RepID=G7DTX1_MIXOS|nr:glycoside hydrolase family 76 protein [Mixia osmundae IAM 14324]KEI41744.1 glycoside hydrolase family 76 protein [Mixia osmundae IAM 14324]GAA94031.1 hypothetical protein E5Q_00678 [Mixia osmundae IAM 14324]
MGQPVLPEGEAISPGRQTNDWIGSTASHHRAALIHHQPAWRSTRLGTMSGPQTGPSTDLPQRQKVSRTSSKMPRRTRTVQSSLSTDWPRTSLVLLATVALACLVSASAADTVPIAGSAGDQVQFRAPPSRDAHAFMPALSSYVDRIIQSVTAGKSQNDEEDRLLEVEARIAASAHEHDYLSGATDEQKGHFDPTTFVRQHNLDQLLHDLPSAKDILFPSASRATGVKGRTSAEEAREMERKAHSVAELIAKLDFESLQPLSSEERKLFDPEYHDKNYRNRKRAQPINTAGLPDYPPTWLNINDVTTVASLSNAVVRRMQTWLGDNFQYEWTPWWENPVLGIAYADLDLALGNSANQALVTGMLNNNDMGVDYMIDKYIDDQAWWGLFALKGYQLYGNSTWLKSAAVIQQNSSLYWDDKCGGGVIWLTYEPNYKNTVTNTLYLALNARLYRVTGTAYYYQEAMRTLNWWLGWAFDPTTGKVYDGLTDYPECAPSGYQIFTYNSGIILTGLVDLYYATGSTDLLDLGRTIAYAAMRDYSTSDGGVLEESCERDPATSDMPTPGCPQDQVTFKGIFMQALGYLYLARHDDNILNYINIQMLSVAANNIDDTWLIGQWWMGPWNETTAGPKTQLCGLAMLATATSANIRFAELLAAEGNTQVDPTVTVTQSVPIPTINATTADSGPAVAIGGSSISRPAGAGAGLLLAIMLGLGLLA